MPAPAEELKFSALDGLALTITVPEGAEVNGKLPVFAFIHGGGYNLGSTSWPQYDFARLVRKSVERGKGVIGVGIK